MGEVIWTTKGHIQRLRNAEEQLTNAVTPTDVVVAISNALDFTSNEFRRGIDACLIQRSSLPLSEIQKTVLALFTDFCAADIARMEQSAESERQQALLVLQECADRLGGTESVDLFSVYYLMLSQIEMTDADLEALQSFAPEGNPEESRRALLCVIHAHMNSGDVGKLSM